jgi:hypothetical protein
MNRPMVDVVGAVMQLNLRAAAAYWILLGAVRLIGRRTASVMAPSDSSCFFGHESQELFA